jgi:dTMP kinase
MTEYIKPEEPPRKGILIAFEGIDGCGKTSQAGLLMSWLIEQNIKVDYSFEPTDAPHGKELRDSFNGEERLSPQKELRLFQLDRLDHVNNLLLPGLREGWVLLVDRYYYSSIAYQGVRGYKSPAEIHQMMTQFAPVPDMTLIFDVDPDVAIERISEGRGEIPNLMEKKTNLEAVKAVFDGMDYPEIIRINANSDPETIFNNVLEKVKHLLTNKKILTAT